LGQSITRISDTWLRLSPDIWGDNGLDDEWVGGWLFTFGSKRKQYKNDVVSLTSMAYSLFPPYLGDVGIECSPLKTSCGVTLQLGHQSITFFLFFEKKKRSASVVPAHGACCHLSSAILRFASLILWCWDTAKTFQKGIH
jgi:hypothetical protein